MFQDGALIINGQQISEPYTIKCGIVTWNMPEVDIGMDEFFVVGDNRSMPISVHTHGRVRRQKIIGVPLFCKRYSLF